jgi:hypothetical protein
MNDINKLLHDLKTKRAHGAGNMITHMVMDEAHAEIIRLRATLDAQSVVAVKPLVWVDERGDGVLTSRETGTIKRIFPQDSGRFLAPSLSTNLFKTPEEAISAYQADHEAFVLRCVEPATSPPADVAQENEYRDVLSAIAFGLGVGYGDETTTADQFNNRINQGLEMFGNGAKAFGAKLMRERAAALCDQHAKKEAARGRGDFIAHQIDRDAIRALPTTFTPAELLADVAMRERAVGVIDAEIKNAIGLGAQHHVPVLAAVRRNIEALPTTFPSRRLLAAAAMRLPEVKALVDRAEQSVIAYGFGWDMEGMVAELVEALAPFARKAGV